MREDVPVVRPSIIESSYKEPFPGWIQGISNHASPSIKHIRRLEGG
ncbi:unnamed protein product [Brassica rapa subsp. narinosa]